MGTEYNLGDRVIIVGQTHKERDRIHWQTDTGRAVKYADWETIASMPEHLFGDVLRTRWVPVRARAHDDHGVVVGIRYLAEGITVYDRAHGEPPCFLRKNTVTAYLVACDLRSNPILCLPSQLARKGRRG